MITKEKVIAAQNSWAKGIIEIGSLKDGSKLNERVINFLDELYSYESGPVLFKPTMASIEQFRNTKQMALSYFIGGTNSSCNEDNGFATKGWTNITFQNHNIILDKNRAIAMGNYYFQINNNDPIKVEYTFAYKLINDKLKIDVHHSSLPYSPSP